MKLQVQTLLNNRYRITAFLSQGGFGYTYLADDDLFGKKVCIKELYINNRSTRGPRQEVITEDSSDFSFEHFSNRFWEEARQLAAFDHPNIVKVKDFFKSNGSTYFVMEYIEGETLQAKKLKGGLKDEQSIFAVMTQLLAAVDTVHNAGMLHRDIKPENVLIANDNRVVLIDFGSARDYEEAKTLTQSTILTPGYAPIEQYSNRAKRGAFTDIYALGATLYFLLTGQKPMPATDRYREQLPSPQQLNPAISTQLSSAVMMAMAMEPEDRFQTVADLKAALLLSGKKVEKPVVTEILPVTELPKPEKKIVQSPAVEEKPVKKSDALIYGGIIAFVFILLAFLVWVRGEKTTEAYCECYKNLFDRINGEKSDSVKIEMFSKQTKACEDQKRKDEKACLEQKHLTDYIDVVNRRIANASKKTEAEDDEETVGSFKIGKQEGNKGDANKNETNKSSAKTTITEPSTTTVTKTIGRCNQPISHEVKVKETLSSIAYIYKKDCNDLDVEDLIAANGGREDMRKGGKITFTCKCKDN